MLVRFLTLFLLLGSFIYWFAIRLSNEDVIDYKKLSEKSLQLRTTKALEEEPAHQQRVHVQKEIFSDHSIRLTAEKSNLQIREKKGKVYIEETLHQIECSLPDGALLKAEEGLYTFPSQTFKASVNCFLQKGEDWIRGTSFTIDFDQGSVLVEHPEGFFAKENLRFSSETLKWEKTRETLVLQNNVQIDPQDQTRLLSKKAVLFLNSMHPTLFELEDHVQLILTSSQGEKSFAFAEKLIYDPKEETFLFSSPDRVLFWKEDMTLSAPEVLIRKDQSVEGRGDVHCTFTPHEKHLLETLFQKYL